MTEPAFVELHCHSCFSLLDGASTPEALVARAAALGMPALALTDHNNLYGAVRLAEAARAAGIRPIFGAELTLSGGHHLTLLVENETGWGRLCRLISLAQHQAAKGEAALPLETLAGKTAGLLALSGCRQGEIAAALLQNNQAAAVQAVHRYRELFGPDNFWLELQHHLLPADDRLAGQLVELARQTGAGYVATNNVHYASRADRPLQEVLLCIRHRTSLARAGRRLRPNSEYYLKPGRQLAPLFAAWPAALANTLELADRCRFELQAGLQTLPIFPTPAGLTPSQYLQQLGEATLPRRYPAGSARARRQLAHELAIIDQAGLANYFLIVADIVRFAREQEIRIQGRGSAANSLTAYLLDISPIDPLAHDLVFERFLSAERQAPPDIDLDIDALRREEVIRYVYERYGADHAAMACTFVTFRSRSARREVAMAFDLPPAVLAAEPPPADPLVAQARALSARLIGLPRHLGLHNGGMVLSGPPLAGRLPTEPAAMPGRSVVQWDKAALEAAGLVKIDLLGLRMLSALTEAEQLAGPPLRLDRLSFDDPAVYELISRADTLGVFQVESRAQAQILPRIRPRNLADLVVTISLIRPGPIQGQMVHPYLRRRTGQEPVTYLHPRLEPALAETLGVILFQEQVLKVARDLVGFSPGQGELLRRALGSKAGPAAVAPFRTAFLQGAMANGVSIAIAETVFAQLAAFGSYAFAKSHAAAFAVIVYQSAWLKRYYPAALLCALLNCQPMGFWSPAVLVGDARRRGVPVLPLDIDRSQGRSSLEGAAVRLGFRLVDGLGDAGVSRLLAARAETPFRDLADLCRRTRLPRRLVEQLIMAGALDGWPRARRQLLWELGQLQYQAEELPLVWPEPEIDLPPLSAFEAQAWERQALGLSTGAHLLAAYRSQLTAAGMLGSEALARQTDGAMVRVAGLVVVHQAPPTAKGFHFLTMEDEAGLLDVVIRPRIYRQFRQILRHASLLVVSGPVQREGEVINVLAEQVTDLIAVVEGDESGHR